MEEVVSFLVVLHLVAFPYLRVASYLEEVVSSFLGEEPFLEVEVSLKVAILEEEV